MRCTSLVYVVTTFLLSQTAGWARLGETEEQISTRHGKPYDEQTTGIGLADKLLIYETDAFMVGVLYYEGLSVVESITFLDERKISRPIGDADIKALEDILTANAGSLTWELQSNANSNCKYFWVRSDEEAVAFIHNNRPTTVTLVDQRFRKKQERARGAEAGAF